MMKIFTALIKFLIIWTYGPINFHILWTICNPVRIFLSPEVLNFDLLCRHAENFLHVCGCAGIQ